MRTFKALVVILIVLAIVAVVLLFTLENQSLVSLVVFGFNAPQLPVSVLLALAFLMGLIVGPILSVLVSIRRGRRLKLRASRV